MGFGGGKDQNPQTEVCATETVAIDEHHQKRRPEKRRKNFRGSHDRGNLLHGCRRSLWSRGYRPKNRLRRDSIDPGLNADLVELVELFRVDDIVISTLPDERSGWLRANLIERVQAATSATVLP